MQKVSNQPLFLAKQKMAREIFCRTFPTSRDHVDGLEFSGVRVNNAQRAGQ